MFGEIRPCVGSGASDFREGSIYEFGEHGAEGESEKLHQEIFDVGRENALIVLI